jgi:hypothetical protein
MFIKFRSIKRLLTLFMPILFHHNRFDFSFLCFLMLSAPLLGIDCLSFPLSGGPGTPSLPFPRLTQFPSDPRQQPVSMSGTIPLGLGISLHVGHRCSPTSSHSMCSQSYDQGANQGVNLCIDCLPRIVCSLCCSLTSSHSMCIQSFDEGVNQGLRSEWQCRLWH